MTKATCSCSRNLAVLCLALSANAATPKAMDRGPLEALAGNTPISVTVALALPAELVAVTEARIVDPSSAVVGSTYACARVARCMGRGVDRASR